MGQREQFACDIRAAGLWSDVAELKRLCAALPECDSVGKLRGKLWRLEASLTEFGTSGNAAGFKKELGSAQEAVRRLHAIDPLTQLLNRLNALHQQVAGKETNHV